MPLIYFTPPQRSAMPRKKTTPPVVPFVFREPLPPLPDGLPGKMQCKYPIGDPRTKGFCFCENQRLPTGPYCEAHAEICYERRSTEEAKRATRQLMGRIYR